jgi:hypothetical protein
MPGTKVWIYVWKSTESLYQDSEVHPLKSDYFHLIWYDMIYDMIWYDIWYDDICIYI